MLHCGDHDHVVESDDRCARTAYARLLRIRGDRAYSAALLSKLLVANGVQMDATLRFLLVTFAGGVVACIFGILVGIPALRLHGDYLAIITLGFGEIIRVIIQNLKVAGARDLRTASRGRH